MFPRPLYGGAFAMIEAWQKYFPGETTKSLPSPPNLARCIWRHMSTETDSPLHQPDPAAIFAIAQSLWEACQTQTARDPKTNLSAAYHGMDQFMRELMRVASQFESWACRYIDFPELDDPWPYLLQDRFGDACLQLHPATDLAAFAQPNCLRVALRLRLPVRRDQGLPVPVDLHADLPSRDGVLGFRALRIQTIRDELPGPQCAAFTWDNDPYDPAFGPPFFGLYGVNAAGLLEHIADRATLTDALALAANLVPGVKFTDGVAQTSTPTPETSVELQPPDSWDGFSIYIDTLCQGPVPVLTGDGDHYVVFKSEAAAQKEIVEHAILRLRQFLAGERDFQDAITVEEYVVPVTVDPDGSFTATL